MDILSQIITGIRLQSSLYARFEARSPWSVQFTAGKVKARFGFLLKGTCLLDSPNLDQPFRLNEGDCFMLLDRDGFRLCDSLDSPAAACFQLMEQYRDAGNLIRFGGDGNEAILITGWFQYDSDTSRLLTQLLPPFMHFGVNAPKSRALQTTLDFLTLETGSVALGTDITTGSLANILFVQAIRTQIEMGNAGNRGFLAALGHTNLRHSIELMHNRIDYPWTIDELASRCGMSRSAFALVFRKITGSTPMNYLTDIRMQRASLLLREEVASLSEIAERVGYKDYNGFAKAFRKVRGCTPHEFRKDAERRRPNF